MSSTAMAAQAWNPSASKDSLADYVSHQGRMTNRQQQPSAVPSGLAATMADRTTAAAGQQGALNISWQGQAQAHLTPLSSQPRYQSYHAAQPSYQSDDSNNNNSNDLSSVISLNGLGTPGYQSRPSQSGGYDHLYPASRGAPSNRMSFTRTFGSLFEGTNPTAISQFAHDNQHHSSITGSDASGGPAQHLDDAYQLFHSVEPKKRLPVASRKASISAASINNKRKKGSPDMSEGEDFKDPSLATHHEEDEKKSPKQRATKACDKCREQKCKCVLNPDNPTGPCAQCAVLGIDCTYRGPSLKRGPPKGYLAAVINRLESMEDTILSKLADNTSDSRSRELLRELVGDSALQQVLSGRLRFADQRQQALTTAAAKAAGSSTSVGVARKGAGPHGTTWSDTWWVAAPGVPVKNPTLTTSRSLSSRFGGSSLEDATSNGIEPIKLPKIATGGITDLEISPKTSPIPLPGTLSSSEWQRSTAELVDSGDVQATPVGLRALRRASKRSPTDGRSSSHSVELLTPTNITTQWATRAGASDHLALTAASGFPKLSDCHILFYDDIWHLPVPPRSKIKEEFPLAIDEESDALVPIAAYFESGQSVLQIVSKEYYEHLKQQEAQGEAANGLDDLEHAMTLAVKTSPGLWSAPVTLFESPASLNKVMGLLLLAHRALSDGDEEKAVNLTASACALGRMIGLHLEQDHRVPSPSELYVAARRRTWSYCVILDKSLMASGHPSSIGSSQLAQQAASTVPASLRLHHVLALIVSDIISQLYDDLENFEKRRYQLHTRLMTWYEALEQEEKAARHTRLYEEWLENRQEGHSTSDHLHGEPSLEFVMACPLPQNWRWSDEILSLVFLYHQARILLHSRFRQTEDEALSAAIAISKLVQEYVPAETSVLTDVSPTPSPLVLLSLFAAACELVHAMAHRSSGHLNATDLLKHFNRIKQVFTMYSSKSGLAQKQADLLNGVDVQGAGNLDGENMRMTSTPIAFQPLPHARSAQQGTSARSVPTSGPTVSWTDDEFHHSGNDTTSATFGLPSSSNTTTATHPPVYSQAAGGWRPSWSDPFQNLGVSWCPSTMTYQTNISADGGNNDNQGHQQDSSPTRTATTDLSYQYTESNSRSETNLQTDAGGSTTEGTGQQQRQHHHHHYPVRTSPHQHFGAPMGKQISDASPTIQHVDTGVASSSPCPSVMASSHPHATLWPKAGLSEPQAGGSSFTSRSTGQGQGESESSDIPGSGWEEGRRPSLVALGSGFNGPLLNPTTVATSTVGIAAVAGTTGGISGGTAGSHPPTATPLQGSGDTSAW